MGGHTRRSRMAARRPAAPPRRRTVGLEPRARVAVCTALMLPFVALFGFVLFGEVSEIWTWVGALVIFAATWDFARREGRGRRGV